MDSNNTIPLYKPKFNKNRSFDCVYDPNYIVSSSKDRMKSVTKAFLSCAVPKILTNYTQMFSELQNYPRQKTILLNNARCMENLWNQRPLDRKVLLPDIVNRNRIIFFDAPVSAKTQKECAEIKTDEEKPPPKRYANKIIQTAYRESCSQTNPWLPDYKTVCQEVPELLQLEYLRDNLPAGAIETELINRMRRIRQWKRQIPEKSDKISLQTRHLITEAIETDQFKLHLENIKKIENMRIELLKEKLSNIMEESKNISEMKINNILQRNKKLDAQKIAVMKKDIRKETRYLQRLQAGLKIDMSYKKLYTSAIEMCCPQNESLKKSNERLLSKDIENVDTLPKWLERDWESVNVKSSRSLCLKSVRKIEQEISKEVPCNT